MQITALELAKLVNGTVEGDENVIISAPSKIEEGKAGTITFLANAKYEKYIYTTKASAVLVDREFKAQSKIDATLIRVDNVYETVASLLNQFGAAKDGKGKSEISPHAIIDSTAQIGADVYIGAGVVIGSKVKIAAGSQIHPQVYLGDGVEVGANSVIYAGVKIYRDCIIGQNCILHSNAVVGSDGFGFAPQEDGSYKKIAQLGNVVIEDWVEVGANTVIDRATMGSTVIRQGVKLDNLIQIAHNVEVGRNSVIAAQSGVAGSTKIGSQVMMGGQVGIVGHIEIADKVKIQAQSGVNSSIKEEGKAIFGTPAIGYKEFLKSYAIFRKLPSLLKRINKLEK